MIVESGARGRLVRNVIELNGAEGILALAGCAPVIGENFVRRNAGDADGPAAGAVVADGAADGAAGGAEQQAGGAQTSNGRRASSSQIRSVPNLNVEGQLYVGGETLKASGVRGLST